MLSDSRTILSGNLAFVDRELKAQDFKVEYFFKETITERKTLKEKIQLCKMMATSKFILVDDYYPIIYPINIRKETVLIQTWHAMGAFKRVGFSRMGRAGGPSPYSLTHKNYDVAICSADSIRKDYAEAFGIDINKVKAVGVPRTDIFFDKGYKKETKEKLYAKYPQIKGKKVIMFAPTFRGSGQKTAHYNFDWIDYKKIEEELGDGYIFINKLHPFIKNMQELPESKMFIDMSGEREINDLLFITDILITDYSSVIFEASLLEIDTIFYVPDFKSYTQGRDFYYEYDKYTYGTVANDMTELLSSIKAPKTDIRKLKEFKDYFCEACDGNATKRMVSEIFNKEVIK